MKRVLRSIALGLLWPVRRFFDPRFQGVHDAVTVGRHSADALHREAILAQQQVQGDVKDLHWLIRADMDATNEAVTVIGRSLRDIESLVEQAWRGSRSYLEQVAEGSIEELDPSVARLLNYANSHFGYAAQAGVWFNPPVLVQYEEGLASIRHVNERIAELPFTFRALSELQPGAEVLDVGASESTVCLSLATLGYQVTAIDPRPNPLSHPNLRVVLGKIEEWDERRGFRATVCLSTIEHIGVGAYEQEDDDPRADLRAMRRIHELTEPGGTLLLTTSYGLRRVDEFSRTYDRAGLDQLLEGWTVNELSLLSRVDETTWLPLDSATQPKQLNGRETVVMISATRT